MPTSESRQGRASDQAAPYVLAGVVYALPLAVGAWFLRRRVVAGGIIGSLEATLLFLVILAPVVVILCREFAPVLLGAFVSGLAGGAVAASLGGFGLMRVLPRSGALS